MDFELSSMEMIMHSGNSRTLSYEAIALVKQKDFELSDLKIKNAKEELLLAQKKHAELLRDMASCAEIPSANLLVVHAEDHISVSEMALDMAKEICELYQVLGGVKQY